MAQEASHRQEDTRCVLWHPPGGELPGDLLGSLNKRIPRLTVCTDSYTVMAELCRDELGRRHADASRPPQTTILLLVNPPLLPEAAEVMEAVRLYAPGTRCWWYDRSAPRRLQEVAEADLERWAVRSAETATRPEPRVTVVAKAPPPPPRRTAPSSPPPPTSTPRLRLAGEGVIPAGPVEPAGSALLRQNAAPPGGVEDPRAATAPLLTQEELRMLLSDDPVSWPESAANGTHPPVPPMSNSDRKPGGPSR